MQGRVQGGGRGGTPPPVKILGGVLPPPNPTLPNPSRDFHLTLLQSKRQ